MENITATELQLLACFGVEPVLQDPNAPWSDNDAAYCVEVEGFSVSFAVHTLYRDVRIIVSRRGRRLFECRLTGVADVIVKDEAGVDAVEVRIAEHSWLRLQMRPVFEIIQEYSSWEAED